MNSTNIIAIDKGTAYTKSNLLLFCLLLDLNSAIGAVLRHDYFKISDRQGSGRLSNKNLTLPLRLNLLFLNMLETVACRNEKSG